MQVIFPAHHNTRKILGKPKQSNSGYRLMTYVLTKKVNEGWLFYHVLTCEFLLLTDEEYEKLYDLPELYEKWFLVPNDLDDIKCADFVRSLSQFVNKKPTHITNYTILPTTDCNARCFYCYEIGCHRISMSEETAHKVSAYIEKQSGGEKVNLAWFGGEPLYNKSVIDIICNDLNEKGIDYHSTMISNGYLFDEETIKQAKNLWKLKWVQITLDGTENIYNRSKAYIYKDGKSPYQTVLNNIEHLLSEGIDVIIRLNLDKHNAEDLAVLIDILHEKFQGEKKLAVYSHVLFQYSGNLTAAQDKEVRKLLYQKQSELQEKLRKYHLLHAYPLPKHPRLNWCMADSGNSQMILPDGNIGLCEHYVENNYIGHIDCDIINTDMVQQFQKAETKQKECISCACYPNCIRLEKCIDQSECYPEMQEVKLQKLLDSMQYSYEHWKTQKEEDTDVLPETC